MAEEKLNISDSFKIIGGIDEVEFINKIKKNKLDKDKDESTIPINENDVSGLDYIIE